MLLSIGQVYELDISFSANATDPSVAESATDPESPETIGESKNHGGALAGIGMLIHVLEDEEDTFLDESSAFTYDASRAATFAGYQEYKNVAQYFSDSAIHPYTLIGVDYAYGMGLSGEGKTIAIVDSEYMTSAIHNEAAVKYAAGKISTDGSLTNGGDWHGAHVSGIAAGDFNNNDSDHSSSSGAFDYSATALPLLEYGMMGVAYDADLLFTDYTRRVDGSLAKGLAANINAAALNRAIVVNNSFGLETCQSGSCIYSLDRFTNYQTANGSTALEALVAMDPYPSSTAEDYQTVLDALLTYQEIGVVIFASGNDETKTEVNLLPGLPVLIPDLASAWLFGNSIYCLTSIS